MIRSPRRARPRCAQDRARTMPPDVSAPAGNDHQDRAPAQALHIQKWYHIWYREPEDARSYQWPSPRAKNERTSSRSSSRSTMTVSLSRSPRSVATPSCCHTPTTTALTETAYLLRGSRERRAPSREPASSTGRRAARSAELALDEVGLHPSRVGGLPVLARQLTRQWSKGSTAFSMTRYGTPSRESENPNPCGTCMPELSRRISEEHRLVYLSRRRRHRDPASPLSLQIDPQGRPPAWQMPDDHDREHDENRDRRQARRPPTGLAIPAACPGASPTLPSRSVTNTPATASRLSARVESADGIALHGDVA